MKEQLISMLNEQNTSYNYGQRIIRLLERFIASSDNIKDDLHSVIEQLSPQAQEKLSVCMYVASMSLSQDWELKNGNDWDDEKEICEKFAYANKSFFDNVFRKKYNYVPYIPISVMLKRLSLPNEMDIWFISRLDNDTIKKHNMDYICGFMEKWATSSSTTQKNIYINMIKEFIIPFHKEHEFYTKNGKVVAFS